MVRRFERGEAIVLREVWHGRPWQVRPEIVVEDRSEGQRLYLPNGTSWLGPEHDGRELRLPDGDWHLVRRTWTDGPILSFAWPEVAHAVLLMFTPGWNPRTWYVNLQDPLRRTELGFDSTDHVLDLIIAPDRSSWRWKDEDELQDAIAAGLFSLEEAETFRMEGERAVARIVGGELPFDRDWSTWRPDPSWPQPELPPGWDTVPPPA